MNSRMSFFFLESKAISEEDEVMMSGLGHASLGRVMMLGICCDIPEV